MEDMHAVQKCDSAGHFQTKFQGSESTCQFQKTMRNFSHWMSTFAVSTLYKLPLKNAVNPGWTSYKRISAQSAPATIFHHLNQNLRSAKTRTTMQIFGSTPKLLRKIQTEIYMLQKSGQYFGFGRHYALQLLLIAEPFQPHDMKFFFEIFDRFAVGISAAALSIATCLLSARL
jgi:hypothetical protein